MLTASSSAGKDALMNYSLAVWRKSLLRKGIPGSHRNRQALNLLRGCGVGVVTVQCQLNPCAGVAAFTHGWRCGGRVIGEATE